MICRMSRTGDKFKHVYKRMLDEWRVTSHICCQQYNQTNVVQSDRSIPKDYSTVVTLQLYIGSTIIKYDSVNQGY